MNKTVEDFLNLEERLRNRSISKRFRTWLSSDKASFHLEKIERALNKGKEASGLLRKAEEAYKSDDTFKRQDNKRKKSLKQFKDAFEGWLKSDKGRPYLEQINQSGDERASEIATLDAEKAFARANPHLLPDDYQDGSKTRIRPVRFARTRDVDDLALDVIEPGLNQLGLVGSTIIKNWSAIVGSSLAQNTRPERVSFPPKTRTHGTLYIKARQGFNTIIQHHSAEIVFRINSHFGFAAISQVRISKRFFEDLETTGKQMVRKVMSTRITPADQPSQRVLELTANIKDPDLKKAFEEFGKVMKARNG